jgi:hypothetical protein
LFAGEPIDDATAAEARLHLHEMVRANSLPMIVIVAAFNPLVQLE